MEHDVSTNAHNTWNSPRFVISLDRGVRVGDRVTRRLRVLIARVAPAFRQVLISRRVRRVIAITAGKNGECFLWRETRIFEQVASMRVRCVEDVHVDA